MVNLSQLKRLVAYGCSHTAGAELGDHILLNLHSDVVDAEKRKLGDNDFNYKYQNILTKEATSKINHSLSYASKLAKQLNLDYENRANVGNSNQGIIYDIELDIANGFLKDDDLLIIGLTSPDRWLYFMPNGQPKTPIYAPLYQWPNKEFHQIFIEQIANSYFTMYNFLVNVKYLDNLSKNLNGRLVQLFAHHTYKEYSEWNYTINPSITKKLRSITDQILKFDSIIDQTISLCNQLNWNTDTHAFYHAKEIWHKKFADYIEILIRNKYE